MKHLFQGALTLLLAASPAVADRTVSKTLPLAADGKVTIDTYKGSIRVAPWDRAEVAVEARIVPDDSCGSERDWKEWVAGLRGKRPDSRVPPLGIPILGDRERRWPARHAVHGQGEALDPPGLSAPEP